MPRIKIAAGDFSGVDAAVGFSDYDGPTPPKGLYRTKSSYWKLVENSSGDLMLKIIFSINEPKGSDKAKFNGYAIWHNCNLTEKGAPYANQMLDALGIKRSAVWVDGIVTKKDDPEVVSKIDGRDPNGLEVMVNTKRKEYPPESEEFKLEAVKFLKVGAASAPAKDDDDDDPDDSDADAGDGDADDVDADDSGSGDPDDDEDSF